MTLFKNLYELYSYFDEYFDPKYSYFRSYYKDEIVFFFRCKIFFYFYEKKYTSSDHCETDKEKMLYEFYKQNIEDQIKYTVNNTRINYFRNIFSSILEFKKHEINLITTVIELFRALGKLEINANNDLRQIEICISKNLAYNCWDFQDKIVKITKEIFKKISHNVYN
ncbi:hypothetical protein GVAV_000728 [Gurleya vavrai]